LFRAKNGFKVAFLDEKVRAKYLEVLEEPIFIDGVEDSAQVICCEDHSDVCCCVLDGFFCHDVVKSPLPFDYAVGVLYDGLPFSIEVQILSNSFLVFVD
jgi:hypothetical protein